MWQKLRSIWIPPTFPDEEKTQTAQTLHWTLWGVCGVLLGMAPFLYLSNPTVQARVFSLISNGLLLLSFISLLFFLRAGYVYAVSWLFIAIIYFAMIPFYFFGNNLVLLAIQQVALLAIAVLLLSIRAFTRLGGASVLLYSLGILLRVNQWFGLPPLSSGELWNAVVALCAIGTIIIINRIALVGIQETLARARRSETHTRALLEAVPDLIFRLDHNGVFLDYQINKGQRLLVPPEDFLGKKVSEVLPEFAEEIYAAIQKTLVVGTVQTLEYEISVHGLPRNFEARLMKSGANDVTVIARDVTEKRQRDLEKQQHEARLQAYLNESPITIYFLSLPEYIPIFFNRDSFCGYSKAELTALGSIKHAVHPDDMEMLNEHWRAISTGQTIRSAATYRLRNKAGGWEWIEERKYIVALDQTGQPKEILVMLNVITERKESEEKIHQLNQVLEKRVEARTAELAISNEALRQSELRYQIVTDLISEYAYAAYINLSGYPVIDWLTPSVEKVTGFTPTEFVERGGWGHILHPHDLEYDTSLYRLLINGKPISGEVRIITKSGLTRWVRTTARPELNLDGEVTRIIGIVTDITERRQAEWALRDSEARLRTVFDLLPVGITLLNANQEVFDINVALERILGLDRSGLFTEHYANRQYFRTDGTSMPIDEYASARAFSEARPVYDVETGISKEDGSKIWINESAAPLPDGGVVVVTSDITARKKSELRQTILYQTLHHVGAYLTPDQVLRAAVDSISHLNDWTSVAISMPNSDGETWKTYAGAGPFVGGFGKARSLSQGIIGRAFRTGQPQRVADVLLDPDYFRGDGQETQARSELAIPIYSRGRILGVLNVESDNPNQFSEEDLSLAESLADIVALSLDNALLYTTLQEELTEREQTEYRLKAVNSELARSNTDLERFAYAVSHDLQEPLRQVMQFTQLLARLYQNKLDEDADEIIDFIVDGANRMNMMVKGLLDYSRLGRSNQTFSYVECTQVLQKALTNLRLILEENAGTVTFDSLPEVLGNELLLSMLFQNLITNAIKFRGSTPPHVHVSAQQTYRETGESEWVISVCDNGIGISPEYFDRIFVIFQRLHTREEYPGTGIGLALCKRIVELHGGRIWVKSEEGQGSTFFFSLPAE